MPSRSTIFPAFETFLLHVTVSPLPEFAASLTDTAPVKISFRTYELSFKIPFKTHILILHKNNKPKNNDPNFSTYIIHVYLSEYGSVVALND